MYCSVCLFVCLSLGSSDSLIFWLSHIEFVVSVFRSVCLSFGLFDCQSDCLSVFLSVSLSVFGIVCFFAVRLFFLVCLSTYLLIGLPTCPFICLCTCLSICLSYTKIVCLCYKQRLSIHCLFLQINEGSENWIKLHRNNCTSIVKKPW